MVEQAGLEGGSGRPGSPESLAQLGQAERESVGPEERLGRVELYPSQAAGVVEGQAPTVGEVQRQAEPTLLRRGFLDQRATPGLGAVDLEDAGHPEVEPEGPGPGVDEEELASPPGAGEAAADERLLEGRHGGVGLEAVRVGHRHRADRPSEGPADEPAGGFYLGQLRHALDGSGAPGADPAAR